MNQILVDNSTNTFFKKLAELGLISTALTDVSQIVTQYMNINSTIERLITE